ncbi:MAG TPA: glycosyltransferase [Casimicrobiaceae bacterium]|jgi:glycosyltransferase involved in cell wall biosynthesis
MSDGVPGLASVVVALNPHDHAMGPVLDAWADQQAAGPFEVIVVDGGARTDFREEAAAHRARRPATPVRTVEVSVAGRAAANNAGVRASRGELIVFVADDFRPSLGLVAAHRRFHAFAPPAAVGIGASYFEDVHRGDMFRRWMEDGGLGFGVAFPLAGIDWRDDYFYVGNASLRRTTFERIGPFDERYRYDLFDDFEFSLRLRAAGLRTRFVPRAIAWHDHDYSLEERVIATTRLGEAAREFESTGDGPRPWSTITELSVEALAAELDALPRPGDREAIGDRTHRWRLALTIAFLRGYGTA